MTRVLVVSHDHPERSVGGGELCAYQLFQSLNTLDGVVASFLFFGDGLPKGRAQCHPVARYADRPGEYAIQSRARVPFRTSYRQFGDRRVWDAAFETGVRAFLDEIRPDVVHFHHLFRIGLDMIALVRSQLPDAMLCLTLHDYKVVCPDNGYMLRRHEQRPGVAIRELCMQPSVDRCTECCSGRSRVQVRRRLDFTREALEEIELFFAPSAFLAQRHIDWGVPVEKISRLPYGVARRQDQDAGDNVDSRRRDRFAFFGRSIEPKGARIFLEAARLLVARDDAQATFIINSTLDGDEDPEVTSIAGGLARRLGSRFQVPGAYRPSELGERMSRCDWVVVPSIWWENSPFVIQEAFEYRRPVLCSNVGGLAEHVRHGIDGLHFRVGDPEDLAAAIKRAMSTPGLWGQLRANILPVLSIEEHRDRALAAYRSRIAA